MSNQSFLIFSIQGSLFAIDAHVVQEILWLPELTPIEEAPPYIAGVFNLRGKIVPVMDITIRFGHIRLRYHPADRVIVTETEGCRTGIIINEVHDVINIPSTDIEASPLYPKSKIQNPNFVAGEAKVGEQIITLLDIANLIGCTELISEKAAIQKQEYPHFCPEATQEERAVFHERAKNLIQPAETFDLTGSSTQIATTVTQHERVASEQAASVNETTTSIGELGASLRLSSEQAGTVAGRAQEVITLSGEKAVVMKENLEGMSVLKEKIGAVAEHILKLSEQTSQIGGIATLVADIAGQINMLALNAAVEAVRAGEHGKGFAIIAQEVRKLADQGKKSAEKVNAIVMDIQKATNSVVMAAEEGTKSAEQGIQRTQDAVEAFNTLAGTARSAAENTQQITLNIQQQAAAIKQIVEAMNTINAGAKEVSAGISQTKAGVEKLNETAGNLKGMV